MKNVILITDVNFWEGTSGNRTRIEALVSYLAKYVDLTVVNTGPAGPGWESYLSSKYNAEFIILEHRAILSSGGYLRKLRSLIKGRKFETVIIEYIHNSYFLNHFSSDTQMILDAHDIISDRTKEFITYNYGGALYEMDEDYEYTLFKCYDQIILLTPDDRKKLNHLMSIEQLLLCPHPVKAVQHICRANVSNITFIGSSYLPNVDGIRFFIDNCWEAVKAVHPLKLQIYGTVCDKISIDDRDDIILNGFVNDANQIYEQADIIINPVRFGAGLKIKNVEALSRGKPLVTTTHGARGLGTINGNELIVADGAVQFTNSVLRLVHDSILRAKIGNAAYEHATRYFLDEQCFNPLTNVIL